MVPGWEAIDDNSGIIFSDLLHNNGLLNVLIRIASMRHILSLMKIH